MKEIHTTLQGNACSDPVIMRGGEEPFSVKVRMAVNTRYFNHRTNEFEDRKPEYFTVYTRRKLARHVLGSVKKGQPLIVTGRLSTHEWTDDQGREHSQLAVQAEAIGHDLLFGTTAFSKAAGIADEPDFDPDTGVIMTDEGEAEDSGDGASPVGELLAS
ncbi:single-stranded DNA-binding protein [Brachybacterium hainanense]|uniref:Single-stranded DNA-binding protein n=1 Tax=Brachybacterium hainanense TaxID=1541174 RepID=A0ABV6R8Z6_9MICO